MTGARTPDPRGYRRGPLEEQVLSALRAGPQAIADLVEVVGHGPALLEGVLRGLVRRGVVEEGVDAHAVQVWRLVTPPAAETAAP